jgi:A/G-specific adenine glycosylase
MKKVTRSNRSAPPEPAAVVRSILRWYARHGRSLPWRKTHNPYRILVSEIMLQQTQVSRVLTKYPEFLRRYPNIASLAAAHPADVIRSWQGMGYNNRALRLRMLAQTVLTQYRGKIPQDMENLLALPGIGR